MLTHGDVEVLEGLYAEHQFEIDYKLKFGNSYEQKLCNLIRDVAIGVHPACPKKRQNNKSLFGTAPLLH